MPRKIFIFFLLVIIVSTFWYKRLYILRLFYVSTASLRIFDPGYHSCLKKARVFKLGVTRKEFYENFAPNYPGLGAEYGSDEYLRQADEYAVTDCNYYAYRMGGVMVKASFKTSDGSPDDDILVNVSEPFLGLSYSD